MDPITREENPISTPTKESSVEFDFTFNGWDSNLVAVFQDLVYTATYTSSIRRYTIRYMNNTQVLKETTSEYGTVVLYDGDIPTYTSE